jgi:hypothetical protein
VSSKEHLQNATQKETQEGTFGRRIIPSGRRASAHHRSNNCTNHIHTPNSPPATIHRVPHSNHRSQKTRGPSGTTNSPSGGARHEYLSSKHYASTPRIDTKPSKPKRTCNKTLKKKLKQSSRMSWCASARRASACTSCKSSNRLNKREQQQQPQ